MDQWSGLQLTGKQYREPAATLHEAEGRDGLKYTIIAFDAAYRGHPAIRNGVDLVASFLEYPMVVGLVEMSHRDVAEGRFAYPTGPFWTLHELLRIHSDLSVRIGLRAGLELAYLVGQIVVEAAENGAVQGCFSHSGLTPWRIGLRPDGDVIVIGHGLPQVDVLCHHADPTFAVSPDSLRYAPPERLAGQPEDVAADTAALTVIAYEVITGRPLYAGHDVEQLARSVSMAEGTTLLSRPTDLPADVARVFAQSLIFDPDTRLGGEGWVEAIGELHHKHQQGDPLAAVAERLGGSRVAGSRRAARLVATETTQFTPEQLKETLAAIEDEPEPEEEPKVETRWSRPSRRRHEAGESEEIPAEAPLPSRRRRRRESPETEETEPEPETEPQSEPWDQPGTTSGTTAAFTAPPPPPPPRPRRRADSSDAPPGRRRRRTEE